MSRKFRAKLHFNLTSGIGLGICGMVAKEDHHQPGTGSWTNRRRGSAAIAGRS